MEDKQKFEAFKRRAVEENERKYGAEIREKYGDQEVDDANARVMGLTQEQYGEWKDLNDEILTRLAAAVTDGTEAEGEEGLAIARLHRRWLSFTWKQYAPAMHRGLAEMYVADERFTAYYDKTVSGCANFLRNAIVRWADEV